MQNAAPKGVTQLLVNWSNGNKAALDEMLPLVYQELRRIAVNRLRQELPNHTLQPTALVNEASRHDLRATSPLPMGTRLDSSIEGLISKITSYLNGRDKFD